MGFNLVIGWFRPWIDKIHLAPQKPWNDSIPLEIPAPTFSGFNEFWFRGASGLHNVTVAKSQLGESAPRVPGSLELLEL